MCQNLQIFSFLCRHRDEKAPNIWKLRFGKFFSKRPVKKELIEFEPSFSQVLVYDNIGVDLPGIQISLIGINAVGIRTFTEL